MIIKIIGDFSNFIKFEESLINSYNFTFFQNDLYLSDIYHKNISNFKKKLNKIFGNKYKLIYLNAHDIQNLPGQIQNWCLIQLKWADVIKYEEECQDELLKTWHQLDTLEKIIQNGGEDDGRTKKAWETA